MKIKSSLFLCHLSAPTDLLRIVSAQKFEHHMLAQSDGQLLSGTQFLRRDPPCRRLIEKTNLFLRPVPVCFHPQHILTRKPQILSIIRSENAKHHIFHHVSIERIRKGKLQFLALLQFRSLTHADVHSHTPIMLCTLPTTLRARAYAINAEISFCESRMYDCNASLKTSRSNLLSYLRQSQITRSLS